MATFGFNIELEEARNIIQIYRSTNGAISGLWHTAQKMLEHLTNGASTRVGRDGVLGIDVEKKAIVLPSGLLMFYHDLFAEMEDNRPQYYYKTRRGPNKIYGGKVVENVCQAIARCIIGEQMLRIAKKCKVVLTVHDSIVVCVRDEMVPETQAYVEDCMRWIPDWADGLPINCESGTGKSYGDCE